MARVKRILFHRFDQSFDVGADLNQFNRHYLIPMKSLRGLIFALNVFLSSFRMVLQRNRLHRVKVKDDIICRTPRLKAILLKRFACPYLKMPFCLQFEQLGFVPPSLFELAIPIIFDYVGT